MRNEVIERELSELVNILVTTVPSLKTVRVTGSYDNGISYYNQPWNSDKSKIDIAVLIGDESFSYRRDRTDIDIGDDCGWGSQESVQRSELVSEIRDQMNGEYKDRFSFFIMTPKDLKQLYFVNEGKGSIGLYFATGRLLHGEKTFIDTISQKKDTVLGYCKQVKSFLKRYIRLQGQNSQAQGEQAI